MSRKRKSATTAAILAVLSAVVVASPASAQNRNFRAPAEWSKRTVALNDLTIAGRRIVADDSGMVQVLLADGTAFILGPGSELVIDSYAYDPAARSARVAASVRRGIVRFVGGKTAPDGVAIDTPFGKLIIDRAMADIDLGAGGGPPHFDMVFGREMQLVRGAATLARVFEPGYSIVPATDGRSAGVRKTPAEWTSAIQQRLAAPRG